MEVGLIIFLVIVVIVCGIMGGNYETKKQQAQAQQNAQTANSIDGFTPKIKINGVKGSYMFAIDDKSKQIALIKNGNKRLVPFNKIMSVEVIEDNKTLSSKSSIRTIGGAVVGGVIAGGAGAIVGSLSGNSTNKKKVSSLNVKIKVRDVNNPNLIIPCFDAQTMCSTKEIKPEGMFGDLYRQAVSQANRIADMISVIIDSEDKKAKTSSSNNSSSTADELAKLADLKSKGVLTEEEFNEQKKKLLNGSSTSQSNVQDETEDIFSNISDVPPEVQEAIDKGQKLVAVKLYKGLTGCGLKEAKDFVDAHS